MKSFSFIALIRLGDKGGGSSGGSEINFESYLHWPARKPHLHSIAKLRGHELVGADLLLADLNAAEWQVLRWSCREGLS